ncbi:hypothetical protein CPB85DRAFT_1428453 [Mucidula mucida]|nr:hypothetical protein CPB85DRAFT_1428453 [Mucidula mucida]
MSDTLYSLARSKLQLSTGTKDNSSLHRWVLLKNSIIHTLPTSSGSTAAAKTPPCADALLDTDDNRDDDAMGDAADTLIYPDVEKCSTDAGHSVASSEAQWFNSLWEELDDDDDEFSSEPQPAVLPGEDDDDALISPLPSPMSSSDDLISQSYFSSPSLSYPYPFPVPYPPFHPPLISPCHFESDFSPPPYHDPLPYFDDYVEDLPVPDAIEDTSDDESESPTTPSLGRSTSLVYVDPASVPLPLEGSRLRHSDPHVYSDTDATFLQSFDFDAFPFPNPNYPLLDEC